MPKYTVENTVKMGRNVEVFLDGEKRSDVIEADTDEGYVVQYKMDGKGFHVLSPDKESFVTEKVFGKVEVRPVDA